MTLRVAIAGGGIGGLAAALAVQHRGAGVVSLFEQVPELAEVGAGVQLGPNAVRRLRSWGLGDALADCASHPALIRSRSAEDGRELGTLSLETFEARYGAPYCTVHRADLHHLLLEAAVNAGTTVTLGRRVSWAVENEDGVRIHFGDVGLDAAAFLGADGVWSTTRGALGLPPAEFTGDIAYRALASDAELPRALRTDEITAWLGPRLHAVTYPVRGSELLNVVVVLAGDAPGGSPSWDDAAAPGDLHAAMAGVAPALRAIVEAMPGWRKWPIHAAVPLSGAAQMARGRIALLGDAAHPMRPYLAQGAGMAIEDAKALGDVLSLAEGDAARVPATLAMYAERRWQRNARVQARAASNGRIFHARGPVRWARDAALAVLGERLMDLPWLYRG